MEYRKAEQADILSVLELIQNTIRTVYPRYYLPGIVEYFLEWHSLERLSAAVEAGQVEVLLDGSGRIIGTGSREGDYIGRVFVLPECQGRGHGSRILARLEEAVAREHAAAWLSASLPAVRLYEHRGYRTVEHRCEETKDGSMLVWDVMEKQLRED